MSEHTFISGQDQPDDQTEYQNHNIYSHFSEYSWTLVSVRGV